MNINEDFSRTLSLLRREKKVSQRTAAKELGISQALLSHYENGVREPGLAFVTRACDYYGVSADFLLGRTLLRDGTTILDADSIFDASEDKNHVLRGSVMATLYKKLIVNSVSMIFDLLGKTGDRKAIRAVSDYLSTAVYRIFRMLYRACGQDEENFFSVPTHDFLAGIPHADMICSMVDYAGALDEHAKRKEPFPDVGHDALSAEYPGMYQSLLQVIHTTGERINRNTKSYREIRKQVK